MLFDKAYVKTEVFGWLLNWIWGLIKKIKEIKTKSVRQVNLVGQVKTLVFLFLKLVPNFNWALKQTLVIIWTWALK